MISIINRTGLIKLVVASALLCHLIGCSSAYYGALEKFGYQKREILRDRITATQKTQAKTAEDFSSALEHFKSLAPFDGGELETNYNRLQKSVTKLENRKDQVRDRIDSVDAVAKALFKEWRQELKAYTNERLRTKSERTLAATEDKFSEVSNRFERAYNRIEPALAPLRDQVLYLKHNLNASAIASLSEEELKISDEVDALIKEIKNASIESDKFLNSLES